MTLFEVAQDLAGRLAATFLRDANRRRPVYGGTPEVPGRSALARPDPLLRILSRRQRCWAWRQPSDRLDRLAVAALSRPVRPDGGEDFRVGPRPSHRQLVEGAGGRITDGDEGGVTELLVSG